MNKDTKKILAAVRKAGWRVERTGGQHYKLKSICGQHIVIVSGTPSDRRSVNNLRAKLKRCGVELS